MNRILLVLGIAAMIPGCGPNINNKDAVRAGVVDYLAKRKQETGLDMSNMNVDVTNVTFDKNEAKATISFQPKSGEAGSMSMNYVLERQGNKWVVKGRKESGMNPHGGGGMQMPGMDPGAQMPPNHPPVDGASPKDK